MIKRTIFNKLKLELVQPEINILLGAGQVGKTTLLKMLEEYAEKNKYKTYFFDLEQPQVLAEFNQPNEAIIKIINNAGQIIFIDEFQYIPNASKIFKAIFDSKIRTKIICSGSSSLEMHKHLKESLAGRRFIFRIYPLQYSEIKKYNSKYSLEKYFIYGGMPGLIDANSEERKQLILSELLSSYIMKDIKSLIKEENIRAFNHLLYLLAENQGSTISINSLSNQIKLSSKAINRYLEILEETYVNFRVFSYSNNLGNELKKSCKTYLYDLGIRNALLKDFSLIEKRNDKGIITETFVFLKLLSGIMPNMEIRFWRTKDGDEVDFILIKNRKPIPIEVKSNLLKPKISKGLKRFLLRYPKTTNGYIVNKTINKEIIFNSCKIKFIDFNKFEKLDINKIAHN